MGRGRARSKRRGGDSFAARRRGGLYDSLWRAAHRAGVAHAGARRLVRGRRHACGETPRQRRLRAYARTVDAFSHQPQDRRIDARAGAWTRRDRDAVASGDVVGSADDRRIRAGAGGVSLAVQLDLRIRHGDHDFSLPRLHRARHQLAHQHPPRDERERYRRQCEGHRQPAQLRNGQIFSRRGTRGRTL